MNTKLTVRSLYFASSVTLPPNRENSRKQLQPYSLIKGDDDRQRCAWCEEHPLYISYHDNEWGVPVFKDRAHFEFIVLESAQAGLSWLTVLRKRKAYRKAYANFDIDKIASWGVNEIETLMNNSGIIRNRKKIEASISNARAFIEISTRHGSFANWLLEFFDGEILINNWKTIDEIPGTTLRAIIIAKELKAAGFRFIGPTITYAHLQATGIVNDHLVGCWKRQNQTQ